MLQRLLNYIVQDTFIQKNKVESFERNPYKGEEECQNMLSIGLNMLG